MSETQINSKPGEGRTLHLYYIAGIIGVTIVLIMIRIIFNHTGIINEFSFLRDVDFKTLHDLESNGLVEYYDHPSIAGFRAQGMDAYRAAILGSYIHGRAGVLIADSFGTSASVLAGEVAEAIPSAIFELIT